MSTSTILLIVFLALFGAVMAFGLAFKYSALIIGGLAIAAAIFMLFRK